MTSQEPGNSDDTVEEIYARFMKRFADGEFLDIVDLYAEYPQYASQLRDLHGQQETVAQSESSRTNLPKTRIVQVQAKRYGILERLAQGGMGVIYKVWDGSLRRELAMKLIRDKRQPKPDEPGVITNPETVARFIREAEITAKLDHPGIVPIHDMGTDEYGRVFFTMRLVRGKRLDQVFELARLQQERWSLTRALDVIVKICETLAFAHSRGVIHRDLKPANIMVGPFGETYVMDWGLAKNISKSSSDDASEVDDCTYAVDRSIRTANTVSDPSSGFMETSDGAIMGTAAYMPPEQAAGLIHELDERSDIYSVGTILYELLAGKRPYFLPDRVRASQIVQAIKLGPPVPLRSLNPKVSQELAAICDKAMARKQEDRYRSIQEMAEDLRAYLEDRVVRAYQTGAIAELRKWVVRNRGLAISSAVGLLIAVGSLLTIVGVQSAANAKLTEANTTISNASIQIKKETDLKGQALVEKVKALEEEQKARKLADEQLRRAEGLLLARASSEVVATNPALALLLALESHDHCPSFSANSAILAALPLHREVRTLVGHRAPIQAASVNAQGTRLVTASNDRTAMIWDIATGKPLTCLVGHNNWLRAVKFSPDGKRIATASSDNTAALWDVETGERLQEFVGHDQTVWQVAFSPDGLRVATGSSDGTVRIWDAATGKELLVLDEHSANVIQVAFSPDGSTLLTGSGDKTARIWDTTSGTERFRLPGHEGGVGVAQFSADGKLVLTTAAREWIGSRPDTNYLRHPSTDHAVRIWDAETGKLKKTLEHLALVEFASFNHDGSRIVTGSVDGIVHTWDSVTGKVEQTLEFREGTISAVTFSPDGRLVAVGSDRGAVRVWDATTGKDQGRLGGHTDLITSVNFISTNQLITTSLDHTARLWNVVSQGAVQVTSTDGNRGTIPVISPDGKRVVIHSRESRSVALCAFPEGHRITEWDHEVPVVSVQFSSLGRFVATLSESGIVRVFAAADGRVLKKFDSTGRTSQVLFCGDQQLVVVEHQSGMVTTWNLETFEMIQRQELPGVKFMRISPGGRYLLAWFGKSQDLELRTIATTSKTMRLSSITKTSQDLPSHQFSNNEKTLVTWSKECPTPKVWETASGRLIAVLDASELMIREVGFASDGASFVTNRTGSVARVWDSQTGNLAAMLSGHESSNVKVFIGPHGDRVVTQSVNKLSRLWNSRKGQSIGLLADRDDYIDLAWFSQDGQVLITLNAKKDKFSLWDAMTGERLATVANGVHPFTNGALSRDGRWFVTGLADGTPRVWPVKPVEHLKSQNLRRLTPDERDLFQIGTEEQRGAYRVTWNENSLVDFLVFQAKAPINGAALTLTARKNAEQAIQTFVESLPPDFTKSQKAAALARVEQAVRKKVEPSLAIKIALAAIFVDNEDFQRGERLLRTVLEQGDQSDPAVWNSFAAVALGGLKRSPREILEDFPKSQSMAAEDLKWVLQTQEAGQTIRIRAGGGDYHSPDGTTWRRDCFFGGGHLFGESFGTPQPSGEPIQKTPDAPLYQTERWFDANRPARERSYRIPLQLGRYRVTLHFAEIYFREPESRVLDVVAEGKVALSNYEPLTAGFATAEQREFETRVDDGLLDLEFRSVKNNPKVSAIEIERLGD